MAKEAGLGLDFLMQVVNVQWQSGLAVEFGDKDQNAPKPTKTITTTSKKNELLEAAQWHP